MYIKFINTHTDLHLSFLKNKYYINRLVSNILKYIYYHIFSEGAAALEGGGPLLSTGLDPWGYPTTASWMNSRSGGGARGGGGFNRGIGSSATEGGFGSRAGGSRGGGEGAAPTRTPAGEGGAGWGEPTASTFGRDFGGGRGGARGSSMSPFMRLFSSLFGLKK
jgi:hypothetical protein